MKKNLYLKAAFTLVGLFCMFSTGNLQAQCLTNACSTAVNFGNFGVEADMYSNFNMSGTFTDVNDDWFADPNLPGPGIGIIGTSAATATPAWSVATFNAMIANATTDAQRNLTYVQRMAVPPVTPRFTSAPGQPLDGYLLLDAVASRDNYANDSTAFLGSNKCYSAPSTWQVGVSSVLAKTDIIDAGGHIRRGYYFGDPSTPLDDIPGALYGYAFATRRVNTGDAYIDFEIFRTAPYVQGNSFVNGGPDSSHTATKFTTGGSSLEQPGDVLVSISFSNGGTQPCASIKVWINKNSVDGSGMTWQQYNALPNRIYTFTGNFFSEPSTGSYCYAEIVPVSASLSSCLFVGVTNQSSTAAGPWGTIGSQSSYSTSQDNNIIAEVAINFSAFGLDINPVSGPCFNLFGSLMVKTKTSASNSATMVDFAGPYVFGNFQEVNADAGEDKNLSCSPTVTLDGVSSTPGATYSWTKAGTTTGIVSGANTLNPVVNSAGCYVLTVSNPVLASCVATDTVCVTGQSDTQAPTVTALAGTTVQCIGDAPIAPTTVKEFQNQGGDIQDISGTITVTHSDSPLSPNACGGTITRTFTITDACGNAATSTQLITVNDNVAPVISGPADLDLGCNPTIPAADLSLASATDNCSASPVISVQPDVITGSGCDKTLTRTYQATDACGNVDSWVQTLTYKVDLDAPVISTNGAGGVLGCNPDSAQINSALGSATATDNCGSLTANISVVTDAVISNGCNRSQTRRFNVSDPCGNTATEQSVTVSWISDTIAPVINIGGSAGPIALGCNPDANAIETALGTATATDLCGSVTPTSNDVITGPACARVKTRTWSAVDGCGNSAIQVSRSVTWSEDSATPVITANGSIANNADLGCNPATILISAALGTASVQDDCDNNLTATFVDSPVSQNGCMRSQTRTWNVTDGCGNAAAPVSRTINWKEDNQAPVVTCSAGGNIVVCNGSSVSITATANDNCDGALTATGTRSDGLALTDPYPAGNTTVSFSATDGCGNTGTCSATVTVLTSPSCNIAAPTTVPTCGSSGNTLSATATNATSYSWTVSSSIGGTPWVITSGANTNTITYSAGSGIATFTLTVNNTVNGVDCSTQCQINVACQSNQRYCSYTQGYYGNRGGMSCAGVRTPALLTMLLNTPLITGSGANTLTLTDADVASDCIFDRLPGGGPSAVLNGAATCSSPTGITLKNNGTFRNVLLAQTITLGLNLRLPGSNLSSLPITGPYLLTYASTGTGCVDSTATPIPGTEKVRTIPLSVINYLGANNTVGDLLAQANLALGNALPAGAPSLSAWNRAVSAFNGGFDECRYFGGFFATDPLDTALATAGNRLDQTSDIVGAIAYPNPANDRVNIEFMLNGYESDVIIEVYNMNGTRVDALFNAFAEADLPYRVQLDATSLAPGVYFYHVNTVKGVFTDKITILK